MRLTITLLFSFPKNDEIWWVHWRRERYTDLRGFFLLLLALLFSNWILSMQQLVTIRSCTLYTKKIQVWKWLSYLANINAQLQYPSSKDHPFLFHSSSNENYCTWIWNMTILSRQFPRFPFHFASRISWFMAPFKIT